MQPEPGALEPALRAAQRGDVAAFNTLVVAYQRQLFNVCYRTLGNTEDAADATQDALLSAFRGLKNFSGSSDAIRGWLVRIAINTCYDQLRRRQRRPTESLDLVVEATDGELATSPAQRLLDPSHGPEQQSLTAETARTIQSAIGKLPPDQRVAVILCDVQGFSYEEVARITSVELGTVKSRLSRARAALREMLLQKGELPAGSIRLEQKRNL